MHSRWHRIQRNFAAGLLVLVPAWGTILILRALFSTLDRILVNSLGPEIVSDIPGIGLLSLLALILSAGALATHLHLGRRLLQEAESWLDRIPLVRSIYLTIKGMTDVLQFRARFDRSTVVVFPFPREGLWAIGFVMGIAPPSLQVVSAVSLSMVFVPTAIHPFTGYLAFIPHGKLIPVNLPPEDAMKMEFSAGLYRPKPGWLSPPSPRQTP